MLTWTKQILKQPRLSFDEIDAHGWGQCYEATDLYPSDVWDEVAKMEYVRALPGGGHVDGAMVPFLSNLHRIGGDQAIAALLQIASKCDVGHVADSVVECTDGLIAAGDQGYAIGGPPELSPGPWKITQAIRDGLRFAEIVVERDLPFTIGAGHYTTGKSCRRTVDMLKEAVEKWGKDL